MSNISDQYATAFVNSGLSRLIGQSFCQLVWPFCQFWAAPFYRVTRWLRPSLDFVHMHGVHVLYRPQHWSEIREQSSPDSQERKVGDNLYLNVSTHINSFCFVPAPFVFDFRLCTHVVLLSCFKCDVNPLYVCTCLFQMCTVYIETWLCWRHSNVCRYFNVFTKLKMLSIYCHISVLLREAQIYAATWHGHEVKCGADSCVRSKKIDRWPNVDQSLAL